MNEKFALITGGSSGIGAAIAEELAKRGHHLLIVALEDEQLYLFQRKVQSQYKINCHVLGIDLTNTNAPEEILEWINQHNFNVNILVNNAGIGSKNRFEEIDVEFYKKQLNINVVNTVLLTRLMIEKLKNASPSYILNLGSLGGFFNIPEKASYVASKAFIHSFSKSISYELDGSGINVVLLCPGGVNTNENNKKVISELKGISRKSIFEPEKIAKIAVSRMFKNHKIIIPGIINKSFLYINRITPENIRKIVIKNQLVKKSKYE